MWQSCGKYCYGSKHSLDLIPIAPKPDVWFENDCANANYQCGRTPHKSLTEAAMFNSYSNHTYRIETPSAEYPHGRCEVVWTREGAEQ